MISGEGLRCQFYFGIDNQLFTTKKNHYWLFTYLDYLFKFFYKTASEISEAVFHFQKP